MAGTDACCCAALRYVTLKTITAGPLDIPLLKVYSSRSRMENNIQSRSEPTLIFDSFDIDLIVKVLSHTAFSKTRIVFLSSVKGSDKARRPILSLSPARLLRFSWPQVGRSFRLNIFGVLGTRVIILYVVFYLSSNIWVQLVSPQGC